ncbi:MAG: hypothetical protein IJF20_03775 [Clostridia bacterium]|nr:hypothetical protein [Clostridia bacterium]
MNIADFAASAVKKIAINHGKKLNRKMTAPDIPVAEPSFLKNTDGNIFNVGFSMKEVMPDDVTSKKYWLAGYRTGNLIKGVLDPLTVRAMWIGCGDGGIILVSADLIGLTGYEVSLVREKLADFTQKTNCKLVSVSCTHTHASIDTVGYWGKLPMTGKDKAYMEKVIDSIAEVCIEAYEDRKEGKLYSGSIHVPEAISDGRMPYNKVNDKLSRLRFVPSDGSEETWFLNYSAHPNTMGGDCSQVSADYPYFLREAINKEKKTNVLFSVGAIASVNIADLDENRRERTRKGGEILAKAALSIDNDVELEADMTVIHQPYYAPIANGVLSLMAIIHVCSALKYPSKTSETGLALLTEMNYIQIGSKKILTIPGEAFKENIYGGYATAEESPNDVGPEVNATPLCEIVGDKNMEVFGVSNDMTGYMIPLNDFVLHPTQPYLSSTRDKYDHNHYHETNGLGKDIPHVMADVLRGMMSKINK